MENLFENSEASSNLKQGPKNESLKQDEQTARDYDKEPIVIKDNNTIFGFMFIIPAIVIMILTYIYNPGGTSKQSLNTNLFLCFPMLTMPYILPYIKSRNKRKVILTEDKIKFIHDKLIVEEINLKEEFYVFKSFEDYYHKSQKPSEFVRMIWFVLLPITIFCLLLIILIKFIFNLFANGLSDYRFFDSIIILQGEKIINILPNSNEEYEIIEKYFENMLNIDIKKLKIFDNKSYHLYEKINYEELKNG